MPDILHEISIAAPLERVHAVATTAPELRRWWTASCEAAPRVGNTNVFRFDGGAVEFHFLVEQHGVAHTEWRCVRAPKVPDEWVDTRIVWELAPSEAGTRLRFGHLGWRSLDGQYRACNTVWGELMHRLRDIAEGNPSEPYFGG
jgi:uncharacterized protein YndB with AHSA1/START domain